MPSSMGSFRGRGATGSTTTYGTMDAAEMCVRGVSDEESDEMEVYSGVGHGVLRVGLIVSTALLFLNPGGTSMAQLCVVGCMLMYLRKPLGWPNSRKKLALAILAIPSVVGTILILYAKGPLYLHLPQLSLLTVLFLTARSSEQRATCFNCKFFFGICSVVLPGAFALSKPSIAAIPFIAIFTMTLTNMMDPGWSHSGTWLRGKQDLLCFLTLCVEMGHAAWSGGSMCYGAPQRFILGPPLCSDDNLLPVMIHYVAGAAIICGFSYIEGVGTIACDFQPSYVMYTVVCSVCGYGLVVKGIEAAVSLGITLIALNTCIRPTRGPSGNMLPTISMLLLMFVSLVLPLWVYFTSILNETASGATTGVRCAWLFTNYGLAAVLHRSAISTVHRDGLMSPSRWDDPEPADPFCFLVSCSDLQYYLTDYWYERTPMGISKIAALACFFFEGAAVPDVPHTVLLLPSCWVFINPKVTQRQWSFLIYTAEAVALFCYVDGWVVTSSDWFDDTFVKPYESGRIRGFATIIIGICLAVHHSSVMGDRSTRDARYTVDFRLPEWAMVTACLLSLLNASLWCPPNCVLLPASLGLLAVGGCVMADNTVTRHRWFIGLTACLTTVSAVTLFAARFNSTIYARVRDVAWFSRRQNIPELPGYLPWFLAAASYCYTYKRFSFSPTKHPKCTPAPFWAPVAISSCIAPLSLFIASMYGTSGSIASGMYFAICLSTALSRYKMLVVYVTGEELTSFSLSHLTLMIVAPVFFLGNRVFIPTRSYWMFVPIELTYHEWATSSLGSDTQLTLDSIVPHITVLIVGLLERWSWIQKAPWNNSKIGPDMLYRVMYEVLLVALLLSAMFEDPLQAMASLSIAVYACQKGCRELPNNMFVPTAVFFFFLVSGCLTYFLSPSSYSDLALHFSVTLTVAAFCAAASTFYETGDTLNEDYTYHLIQNKEVIDQERAKGESGDLHKKNALDITTDTLSTPVKGLASVMPYFLLLVVFFDGALQYRQTEEGGLVPLSFTEVARVLFAVIQIPSLDQSVWRGNNDWCYSHGLYVLLLFWWLLDQASVIPVSFSENGGTVTSGLLICAVLWRWGRFMDSKTWGEVLLFMHDVGKHSKSEATRIEEIRKRNLSTAHKRAVAMKKRRLQALHVLLKQKTMLTQAMNKLFFKNAETPPLQPEMQPLPMDVRSEAPTAAVPWFPTLCSGVLQISYKPRTPEDVQEMLETNGYFSTVGNILHDMVLSLCAEGIYLGTACHFISNPCFFTLLPFATVLLYAMCSSPQPMSGYWRWMIWSYQALIFAKSILLCFFMKKGSVLNSNSSLVLMFGWRTSLQADGELKLVQFVFWETLLLSMLLLHRYALTNVWGLWGNMGDRMIPVNGKLDNTFLNLAEGAMLKDSHCDMYNTKYAVCGGVQVTTDITLGGTAVQFAAQGSSEVPAALNRKQRRIWRNLFNTMEKFGADLYAPAFVVDLTAWVVLLVGFSAIMGSNEGIAESIKNNLLPGSLVLALFVLFLVMVSDRIVYLLRSLYLKTFLHVFLTAAYLLSYVWWCYSHVTSFGVVSRGTTGEQPALVLQLFCALKMLCLAFSALQVRYGYPDFVQSHFFAWKHSSPWLVLYTVYRAVPFLFEFRSVLDWTFTKTSLKMAYWLRLEDITHEIHVCLCDRHDTKKLEEERKISVEIHTEDFKKNLHPQIPENEKKQMVDEHRKLLESNRVYPKTLKCRSGAALLCTLSVILFFPLMWYSSIGPALVEDFISESSFDISLSSDGVGYGTLYQEKFELSELTQKKGLSLSLPVQWTRALESTRPNLAGFGLSYGGTKTVQVIPFIEGASTLWGISDMARTRLEQAALKQNSTMTIIVRISVKRPAAPMRSQWVQDEQRRTLSGTELQGLRAVLNGTQRSFELPLLYTPFLFNRVEALGRFSDGDSNKISCTMGLQMGYWNASCRTIFEMGNPPGIANSSGMGDFPLTPAERNCIHASVYEATEICKGLGYSNPSSPQRSATSGPYAIAISDLIASGSMSVIIPSLGVVALYTTFVLAVGRILRASLTGDASKLHLTDLDSPESVYTLIDYIRMARVEGDLEIEHGLYKELVYLLRTPEAMRQWTLKPLTPVPSTPM